MDFNGQSSELKDNSIREPLHLAASHRMDALDLMDTTTHIASTRYRRVSAATVAVAQSLISVTGDD